MDKIDKSVAKEAVDVLFNTEMSIVKKVPNTFIKFLIDNASGNEDEIIIGKNIIKEKEEMSDEVKAVIAMVYRDFICSDEEKAALDEEIEKMQEEIYQPFRGRERENIIPPQYENKIQVENKLIVEPKWYDKILGKIKFLFKTK